MYKKKEERLSAWKNGGLKIYKNTKGVDVTLHKHPGINGYHDANLLHQNKLYAHRRWKDNPLGCLNDVQKIEKDGSL